MHIVTDTQTDMNREQLDQFILDSLPDNTVRTITPTRHRGVESAILDYVDQESSSVVSRNISFEKVITSAEILASATTPIEVIPSAGLGKIVALTELFYFFDYGTATYVETGTSLLSQNGNDVVALPIDYVANQFLKLPVELGNFANQTVLSLNSAIQFESSSAPTTGDGDIYLYGTYKVLDFN